MASPLPTSLVDQHEGNQVELNFSSGSEGEELLIKDDPEPAFDGPPLLKPDIQLGEPSV